MSILDRYIKQQAAQKWQTPNSHNRETMSLTRRKYFQKLGLTENIWENIMGYNLLVMQIPV